VSHTDRAAAYATPPVAALPDRACNGADPELFFPEQGGKGLAARAICAGCRYRKPCLDWALDTRQGWGIWGGLGPTERAELTRRTP
jgi:WhiB family redox-sensing transcriptional regulator